MGIVKEAELTWIDGVIVIVLLLYLIDGYRRGLLEILVELMTFAMSLILAWFMAESVGRLISSFLKYQLISYRPIGLLVSWFLVQFVLSIVLRILYKYFPVSWREAKWNKFAGIAPSLIKAVVLIAIVLAFMVDLPYKNQRLTSTIDGSYAARNLSDGGNLVLKSLLGNKFDEATKFFTLESQKVVPGSNYQIIKPNERVDLGFTLKNYKVDPVAEKKMLGLVNAERKKKGLSLLVADPEMQKVARVHAADMYTRGYFSHTNPDGLGPFDRMNDAKVVYTAAGENLAFSVDVEEAHKGLMLSPGHRANILEKKFGRVGIGILYGGGKYEMMFVQNFRN